MDSHQCTLPSYAILKTIILQVDFEPQTRTFFIMFPIGVSDFIFI